MPIALLVLVITSTCSIVLSALISSTEKGIMNLKIVQGRQEKSTRYNQRIQAAISHSWYSKMMDDLQPSCGI